MKKFFIFLLVLTAFRLTAQLPNGSTAPNWTMSDISGTSHTLYNYLNNGKVVVMDFSAAWCSNCWGYHNSGALKNFQNAWGPATQNYKAQVFFIEAEANNTTGCLYGNAGGGTPFQACTGGSSTGNWVANTPYPIIDNASQNTPYQIVGFPRILMVCPTDKKVYNVGKLNQAELEAKALEHCGVSLVAVAPINYTVTQQKNIDCNGATTGAITLNVTGGATPYTYAWSNSKTTAAINNLAAGTYTCTITDNNGTKKITTPITLTENTAIATSFVTSDYEKCGKKGSISTTVSGGNGIYTYLWSNNTTNKNILNLQAGGNFTLTVTDGLGCKKISNTLTIKAFTNEPTLTLSGANQTLNCSNGTITVTANAVPTVGDYRFLWDDFSTAKTRTINVPSQYFANVTDTLSKCFSQQNFTINADFATPIVTAQVVNIDCKTPIGKITATQKNNYTYAWLTNNGKIKSGNSTNSIEAEKGNYRLTVTDTNNGCTVVEDYIIADNIYTPTIATESQKNVSCNGGNNGSIKIAVGNANNPIIYTWSNNATTQNIENLKAGAYSLTIQDGFGCKNTFKANITEPTPLLSTTKKVVFASQSSKNDGSIDVDVSGGTPPYTFQWTKGGQPFATTEDLQNIGIGKYALKIKDANDCQASMAEITVSATAIKVTDIEEVANFSFSPNPTDAFLNINLKLTKPSTTKINIISSDGKAMFAEKIFSQHHIEEKINVSELPAGLYFLQINVNDKVKLEKFIKN
jgi:SprB repeat/Secretion system C-terminal sorting domain